MMSIPHEHTLTPTTRGPHRSFLLAQRLFERINADLTVNGDEQALLNRLAHLLLPELADGCIIDLIVPAQPDQLQRVVVAHANPQRLPMLTALTEVLPVQRPWSARSPLLSRGEPVLLPHVGYALESVALDADHLALLTALRPRSLLLVPLCGRNGLIGVLSLTLEGSGRHYSPEELVLATDIANRAALLLDNARLYAAERAARAAAEAAAARAMFLALDNARLYRDAQEAVETRDTFLSIASHELKTPLTALLGQAQLLQRRLAQTPATSSRDLRAINTIVQQSQRLSQLISTMLDLSRLETGQLALVCAPLDLGSLAAQVVEELQPTLEQHQLCYCSPPEPLIVSGDAMRLTQVLQNLLQNAIKYSPNGGPIELDVRREGQEAALIVRDYGLGIASEDQERLFERFFRTACETTNHISGIGVGLYVVREIATLHGGRVTVKSAPGQGSTFTVWLPLIG